MEKVCVLMSTYNGEKYLKEQLDSVLSQDGILVDILIRDDGSNDGTISILDEYSCKYNNIHYYQGSNLGPAKSFLDLIVSVGEYKYYALCDQDDVWDKDKLICAVRNLKKMNNKLPLLYYSNLRIVDEKLNFLRLSHKVPHIQVNKYSALVEYMMTGCTGVFNFVAKKMISGRIPDYCSMHDAWIYTICKMFGDVHYDFMPHISYRQHGDNVIGAYNPYNIMTYISKIRRLCDKSLQPRYKDAINFYECFLDVMSPTDKEKVEKIIQYKKSFSSKLRLLMDKDLCAASRNREWRNKFLILAELL